MSPITAEDRAARVTAFRALHDGPGAFVIPNPYDAGSARVLTAAGFKALATTSAGAAFVLGRRDGALSREEVLANARAIVGATDLAVSADLADGYGRDPEIVAATIRAAAEAGLAGGSIEDVIEGDGRPIDDLSLAVARVVAAAEAARAVPGGFVVTARAEAHLFGPADVGATIARLIAFAEAGADVLYAPGLPSLEAIATVCAAVPRPVNVLVNPAIQGLSVATLTQAGARRISLGGLLAFSAMAAVARAAEEMRGPGTFGFAVEARAAAPGVLRTMAEKPTAPPP